MVIKRSQKEGNLINFYFIAFTFHISTYTCAHNR